MKPQISVEPLKACSNSMFDLIAKYPQ